MGARRLQGFGCCWLLLVAVTAPAACEHPSEQPPSCHPSVLPGARVAVLPVAGDARPALARRRLAHLPGAAAALPRAGRLHGGVRRDRRERAVARQVGGGVLSCALAARRDRRPPSCPTSFGSRRRRPTTPRSRGCTPRRSSTRGCCRRPTPRSTCRPGCSTPRRTRCAWHRCRCSRSSKAAMAQQQQTQRLRMAAAATAAPPAAAQGQGRSLVAGGKAQGPKRSPGGAAAGAPQPAPAGGAHSRLKATSLV